VSHQCLQDNRMSFDETNFGLAYSDMLFVEVTEEKCTRQHNSQDYK